MHVCAFVSQNRDLPVPQPNGRELGGALTRFLDDGRLCMSNNAAERELRAVAVGRRNAGSDEGGRRAAAIYTLIATAKLSNVDPQAWLADVLARLPDHPAKRIGARTASPPRPLERVLRGSLNRPTRGLHRMLTLKLRLRFF